MKRSFSLILMLLVAVLGAVAKGDKLPKYDIQGAGSGVEGTVLVKVYVYSKAASDQDFKRAAVHGIVFRGCEGNSSGAKQPAMASPSVESENDEFCKSFFATDGLCQNFATIIAGSYDRVKTKKGYKLGAMLQVNKTALRKELEKAGIIRALSSGF